MLAALKAGVSPDIVDKDGNTPLILATKNDNHKVVEVLLRAGCQVDRSNMKKRTALMYAVLRGQTEIVNCLMAAGCDVTVAG